MIGCIKATSPCVKSASAELFPDLHSMSAPSGEERTLDAAAQVERAALRYASAASAAHSRVYSGCAAEAAVSEASGPRVSGCIRAPWYFATFIRTPYVENRAREGNL